MLNTTASEPSRIQDKKLSGICPRCGVKSQFTLVGFVSATNQTMKGASVHTCFSCNAYIFIEWQFYTSEFGEDGYYNPEMLNAPIPIFDFRYIPETIKKVFQEALICYGDNCFNAFAAMCRRTIQAIFQEKGIEGTTRIHNQLFQYLEESNDDEMKNLLNELIKTGHDGSHPHLPEVTEERAIIMYALMEDVFEQIYIRPGKISEAKALRDDAIKKRKLT
jgi:hypothetical protein